MAQVRKHFLTLLLTLIMAVAAKAQTSGKIVGNWKDDELPKRLVEFYQGEEGLYYGRIVRDENEDLNGKVFIKKLRYDESAQTYTGLVSPPDIEANIEIKTTISWVAKDTLQVVVRNIFQTKKILFTRAATK